MLPQLTYVQIDEQPSARVLKILHAEPSVQPGGSYVALGFLGMKDAIVIVDNEGKVITLPYDEDSFSLEE